MAAFAGAGRTGPVDYIYYEGTGWNSTDNMYVLKFNGADPAKPVLENIAATRQSFGFSSGSPVITSNGAAPASATVWEVQANDDTGAAEGSTRTTPCPPRGYCRIWSPDRRRVPVHGPGDQRRPGLRGRQERRHRGHDGKNATVCPTDFESAAIPVPTARASVRCTPSGLAAANCSVTCWGI